MKCGREPEGERVYELGICPASTDKTLNGKNGGRCCWKVAGTFCGGEVQGFFASKVMDCIECDFLKGSKMKKEMILCL